MATAEFVCVFQIVIKIFFVQQAIFIAYEAIGLNLCRVELYLQLYILCDGEQRAANGDI